MNLSMVGYIAVTCIAVIFTVLCIVAAKGDKLNDDETSVAAAFVAIPLIVLIMLIIISTMHFACPTYGFGDVVVENTGNTPLKVTVVKDRPFLVNYVCSDVIWPGETYMTFNAKHVSTRIIDTDMF